MRLARMLNRTCVLNKEDVGLAGGKNREFGLRASSGERRRRPAPWSIKCADTGKATRHGRRVFDHCEQCQRVRECHLITTRAARRVTPQRLLDPGSTSAGTGGIGCSRCVGEPGNAIKGCAIARRQSRCLEERRRESGEQEFQDWLIHIYL